MYMYMSGSRSCISFSIFPLIFQNIFVASNQKSFRKISTDPFYRTKHETRIFYVWPKPCLLTVLCEWVRILCFTDRVWPFVGRLVEILPHINCWTLISQFSNICASQPWGASVWPPTLLSLISRLYVRGWWRNRPSTGKRTDKLSNAKIGTS